MVKISTEVTQKMDCVIAEKVMGWTPGPEGSNWFNGQGEVRNIVPPYSTDMNAAWEVVNRMKFYYGYSWWFTDCGSEKSGTQEKKHKHFACASLRRTCATHTVAMGQAHEMPMAICLAALKVIHQMEIY